MAILHYASAHNGGLLNNKHNINLLTGVNPDNPYEVELRHDANGDIGGSMGDALIAFNLDDLPPKDGQTVKLKLNWKSFSGHIYFVGCS